jgi:LuxR family maltose regulon positive regulatory protein
MSPKRKKQSTVLLVDDHPTFRKGLHFLLEDEDDMQVVGEAGDGQEALALIKELSPDVVVMDITMPGLNGIEATNHIASEFPDTKVVALSIHSDKLFVQDMLLAGAAGYILKESVPEDLVKGIRAVLLGAGYLSPAITGLVVSRFRESVSREQFYPDKKKEILATKLHMPQPSKDYIHRPRLVKFLEKNRQVPLQTVTAPAGYGKSSLVGGWLTMHEWPNSWVSLDENENDLRQFMSYFVHAINTLFPGVLSETMTLLEKGTDLPPIQILAARLSNEIDKIEQDFILVLDDFYLIKEKRVHDLLSEILRHPLAPMHFIVLSRTEPFLPTSRLRAKGMLAEVRLQDLRFTVDETREYLQHILNIDIDESTAREWNEKTEGWVTGLRLSALSVLHRNDLNSLFLEIEGSSQFVKDYLFNEVLASQPENVLKHLMSISILERFSAPLCEALCSYSENECGLDDGDVINWLKEHNLFLIPLENDGRWYRFHHMFKELLQKQLIRYHSPEDILKLHTRACAWFTENGFIEDAIKHAVAADDMDDAVRLVEQNRQNIHNSDQWYILEKWLAMFPEAVIQQQKELLMARIWVHYHHFDIEAIPAIVNAIKSQLDDAPEHQALQGEIDFFLGYIYYFQNNGLHSLQHLQNALDRVPETYHGVRGQIEILYGLANQMQFNKDDAINRLYDLFTTYQMDKSVRKTRLLITFVYIHIISGDLSDALIANQKLYDFSHKGDFLYAESWSRYLQGLIHFYQNDLDEAIACFRQAVDNKYILHTRATVDSMIGLALAYQAKGLPGRAIASMQELLDYITPLNDPEYKTIARMSQIRLSIMQGLRQSSTNECQQLSLTAENMVWWLEIPKITCCRALYAKGSRQGLQEAENRLQELLQQNQANHNVCQMIQILPLLAMIFKKQGRDDEALETLKQTVNLAEPGDWVRPFVEVGPPMEDLLLELQEQNFSTDFIGQLLAAFQADSQKVGAEGCDRDSFTPLHPVEPSAVDSLTNRENEILELLIQGKTNKEIAAKLFVAIDTTKTHLKNIYQKLEVNSRLQAVAKANALGFIGKRDGGTG